MTVNQNGWGNLQQMPVSTSNVDINYVLYECFVSLPKTFLLFSLANMPCFLSEIYTMMFTSGRFHKMQLIDIFDQGKGKVKLDQFNVQKVCQYNFEKWKRLHNFNLCHIYLPFS
jgi:hypothetical protein